MLNKPDRGDHEVIQAEGSRSTLRWKYGSFVLILLSGVLARIPFYLAYKPVYTRDSSGYLNPYFFWINHHFFTGERTPVYPLFLGLAQWLARAPASPMPSPPAAYTAVCLQSFLDMIAACLLCYTLRLLRVRKSIALLSALLAATIPGLCLFEMNLLNLSLSFFWLTLGATIFAVMMKKLGDGRGFAGTSLLAGIVLGCAGLLRPENLVFLTVLAAVMVGIFVRSMLTGLGSHKEFAFSAILMLMSAAPLVLAWMAWNYVGIGEFRITTLTGWNRSKLVYNMFDRVDAEDRVLGEILSSSYRQCNRNGRIVRDHIWAALPVPAELYREMPVEHPTKSLSAFHQKVDRIFDELLGMKAQAPCDSPGEFCATLRRLGMDAEDQRPRADFGDYVGKVSTKLIRKYPDQYFHNVADNFVHDTFDFRYTDARPAIEGDYAISVGGGDYLKNNTLAGFLVKAVVVQAPLLAVLYVITLGFVVFSPLVLTGKAHDHAIADTTVTALALATVGTFVATCMLSGFNSAYSVPHLGVMVICSAYAIENRVRIVTAFSRPVTSSQSEARAQ